ncbi:MAG: hypothetical protein R6W06_03985, partial [Prochlorococcaceae cyanobacterium]
AEPMLIYVCISAHGFGHGARIASVLAVLAQRQSNWRFVLSTSLPDAFLAATFKSVPHTLRPCRWDVGVVQADALGVDAEATLTALAELELRLPAQLQREASWLEQQGEPVLILADVPPAALLLAEQLQLPLVWQASFGWDAIYGAMGPAFSGWKQHCLDLYRRGNHLIACPLAMPMPWGLPRTDVGLTAAAPRWDGEHVRRLLDLPAERGACVLICFGGLGYGLEPGLLRLWPGHRFVVVDPRLAQEPNARLLPDGWRPLDAMAACGRVISKPGYSTFCEALSQGVGIHLVHREGFAEAAVLEAALQRHGWHRLLSQEQLLAGDWQLDQPLLPPLQGCLPGDGAAAAAACLEKLAAGLARRPGA